MKEPSPLVPQGSFEAQARSKSRVKLAFYTIVAIHVLAICGFLIIGCKREDKDAAGTDSLTTPTNDLAVAQPPPFGSDPTLVTPVATNTNPPANLTQTPPTNIGTPAVPTGLVQTPVIPTNPPVIPDAAALGMTEHTIVKGDSFSTLAIKYGVSLKAIQLANPGKDSSKLQLGEKIKIPPKVTTPVTSTTTVTDPNTYTVKSGDTLSKIAASHKTTIKELQRLNGLSTTQIKVGQKLKLPAAGTTPPPAQ